jgi:predicted aspartyl protease
MPSLISVQSPHLRENGPIYPVVITPSFSRIASMRLKKKDVPHIKVKALFDTGAQSTAVSKKVADFLKLTPRGTVRVYTSHTSRVVNKYDIALEFDSDMYMNNLQVFGADLREHSIDCLIGRDVLRSGVFTYDGPNRSFKFLCNGRMT